MQNDYDCYFCIVDQHAITMPQDRLKLRKTDQTISSDLFSFGIQSTKQHNKIPSPCTRTSRMDVNYDCFCWRIRANGTQYKDKAQKAVEGIPAGLLTYPPLMAAEFFTILISFQLEMTKSSISN